MSDIYADSDSSVIELKYKTYPDGDFTIGPYGMTRVVNPEFHNKNGLIMFYSPNCGHCRNKDLVKTWKNLSIQFGSQFLIAAVNCVDKRAGNDVLSQYAEILGYPTIKFVYKDGTVSEEYTGPRTTFAIKKYICSKGRGVCK